MDSPVSHEKGSKLLQEAILDLVASGATSFTNAFNFTWDYIRAPSNQLEQYVKNRIAPVTVSFWNRYIGIYATKQIMDWFMGKKTLQQALSLQNVADQRKAAIGAFLSMVPKAKADTAVPYTKYSPQYIRNWKRKQEIKQYAALQDKAIEEGPKDTSSTLAKILFGLGIYGYGMKQALGYVKHQL